MPKCNPITNLLHRIGDFLFVDERTEQDFLLELSEGNYHADWFCCINRDENGSLYVVPKSCGDCNISTECRKSGFDLPIIDIEPILA